MRSPAARLLLSLVILACGACGGGDDKGDEVSQAEACAAPTPAADTSLLGKLPVGLWGTITIVEKKRAFIGAQAISETQIVELFPQMVRDLTEAGYVYLGGENEGFEAELAFSSPKETLVSFALRETDCKKHIRIRVLIEQSPAKGSGRG